MTREDMAQLVIDDGFFEALTSDARLTIANELRKTCATCQHFQPDQPHLCNLTFGEVDVPLDGSGYCHNWELK